MADSNEFDDILWGADMNWHRGRNTQHSDTVDRFIKKLGLMSMWKKYDCDFTHIHTDNKSISTIDHWMCNERLSNHIIECLPIHPGDNLSRHSPIMLKLRANNIPKSTPSNIALPRRPAWYKVGQRQIDLFTKTLHNKLVDLPRPFCLDCINVNCSHVEQHSSDRDDYVLDLLSTAIEVSHLTIPMTSGVKKKVNPEKEHFVSKNIPGWQEHVKEFRDDSIFWHSIWISCGRPNKGVVHSIMSSTRNKYHYAIRRVKKLSEEIRAKNLFSASLQGDINLLKEMKKIKGSKKESLDLPDTVEDANGPDEIVDKFREVYEDLYNSADTSEAMNLIKDQLRLMIGQDSVTEVNKVHFSLVRRQQRA